MAWVVAIMMPLQWLCYHVIVLIHKEFAGSVKNSYNLIFVHRYYSFQVGADKRARSERVAESA